MSKTNGKKAEIKDIIRSSPEIKNAIREAMLLKSYSYGFLIAEAESKGVTIDKAALSRYITNDNQVKGVPTQEAILFLCKYMNINVKLLINGKEKSIY